MSEDKGWRKAAVVLAGMAMVTILAALGRIAGDTALMSVCGLATGYAGLNMLVRKVGKGS